MKPEIISLASNPIMLKKCAPTNNPFVILCLLHEMVKEPDFRQFMAAIKANIMLTDIEVFQNVVE
jgi:hypothetical protein